MADILQGWFDEDEASVEDQRDGDILSGWFDEEPNQPEVEEQFEQLRPTESLKASLPKPKIMFSDEDPGVDWESKYPKDELIQGKEKTPAKKLFKKLFPTDKVAADENYYRIKEGKDPFYTPDDIELLWHDFKKTPYRIKKSWDAGVANARIGQLNFQKYLGNESPEIEAELEIMRKIASGAPKSKFGLPEDALQAVAKMLPIQVEAGKKGLTRGLATSMAAGSTAAILTSVAPEAEIITVPTASAIGFRYGMMTGSLENIIKMELGLEYEDLSQLTDQSGNKIDPNIIKAVSLGVGTINGILEMASIKTFLNTIPGFKSLVRGAERKAINTLIKDKTLKNIALEAAKKYGKFILTEDAQEVFQEITSIAGDRLATELSNNLDNTNIPTATKEEIVTRLKETLIETTEAMSIMGLPGLSVGGVHEYVSNKQNARAEAAQNNVNAEPAPDQPTPQAVQTEQTEIEKFETELNDAIDSGDMTLQALASLKKQATGEYIPILSNAITRLKQAESKATLIDNAVSEDISKEEEEFWRRTESDIKAQKYNRELETGLREPPPPPDTTDYRARSQNQENMDVEEFAKDVPMMTEEEYKQKYDVADIEDNGRFAERRNQIPEELRPAIETMKEQVISGGVQKGSSGGEYIHTVASTYPDWIRGKNQGEAWGKDEFWTIVNKAEKGEPLTVPQRQRFAELLDHAKNVSNTDMEFVDQANADEYAKEGFTPAPNMVAGDLNEGDKVIIRGEEFEHKGRNKNGDIVLEDGKPVIVDDFDKVPADFIKKGEPTRAKDVLESSGLAEKPNMSSAYIEAKKQPTGKYKLFFRGTRNEVFAGKLFDSAKEARTFFEVQKIKAQEQVTPAKPEPQKSKPVDKAQDLQKKAEPKVEPEVKSVEKPAKKQGEPIPENVLKDFPELKKESQAVKGKKTGPLYQTKTMLGKAKKFEANGAEIKGDNVILYRGGDVSKKMLRNLRYGDYLSSAKTGFDSTGNEGASGYGKNVVKFELPISDVEVTGAGEFQYKGKSKSLKGGRKYPVEIYKAYNDVYGSNYTAQEIDAQDNVRSVASQGLPGGRDEFDALIKTHKGEKSLYQTKTIGETNKKYREIAEAGRAELVNEAKKYNTVEDFINNNPLRTKEQKRKAIKQWKKDVGYEQVDSSFKRGGEQDSIHSPSDPESGSPLYDLTENGTYPDDVYSYEGLRYYGTGEDAMDRRAYNIISFAEGHPGKSIKVYRAVEEGDPKKILPGDWVTTVRSYAKEHGEGTLGGKYKIVSKTVSAKDLYTSGDSWLEYGYHPQPRIPLVAYTNSKQKLTNIYNEAHGKATFPQNKSGVLFQSKSKSSSRQLTSADIQKFYTDKGQSAGVTKNGSVWVRTKRGHGFVVNTVAQISPNEMAFEMSMGRMRKDGELIAGKTENGDIYISKIGDIWTLNHENYHKVKQLGIIKPSEENALRAKIKELIADKKWETKNKDDIGGEEDQAYFVESELAKREAYRGTKVGKVLQKIADFIESLVNVFKATPAGVIQKIESGKIFNRNAFGKGVKLQKDAITPEMREKALREGMPLFQSLTPEEQAKRFIERFKKRNPGFSWPEIEDRFNATEKKVSGVSKSIEAKAIEQGMIDKGYDELALYDSSTIKKQAELGSKYSKQEINDIAIGRKELPEGMKAGTALSIAEDNAKADRDIDLMINLAKSPLSTQISESASELSLSRMREKESAVSAINEVIKSREKFVEEKSRTKIEKVKKKEVNNIKESIKKEKATKDEWLDFVESIKCA